MKKIFFFPFILVVIPSEGITSELAALQNEARDYWSQLKQALRYVADGFTLLGDAATATAITDRVNSIGNEQIINWSDLKPTLVVIKDALDALGETALAAEIDALLQQIANDNNQVYADQVKPILANVSEALANLGQ